MARAKIGNTIRSFRIRRKLSQAWVAKKAGISASHLSQIESEEHEPNVSTLGKLAGAMQCTVSQLITEIPDVHNVMVAAACIAAGVPYNFIRAQFSAATIERLNDIRGGLGLRNLAEACLNEAGISTAAGVGPEELKAAFSSSALPEVLLDAANKIVLAAFTEVESIAPLIASEADVSSFEQSEMYSLTSSTNFEVVSTDGFKHGELSPIAYPAESLATHGAIFTISRQAIISNDTNALASIPRLIGRNAKIAIEAALIRKLLGAGTFFSAANANLITGVGSALSTASLAIAETKLRKQTDNAGNPLMLRPAILAVPPELKDYADSLCAERALATPEASRILPATSPFFSHSALTGSSTTAWFLVSPPVDVAALVILYLNGRRVPQVDSAPTQGSGLGTSFRGYFDFSANLNNPKAIIKSEGA